MTYSWKYLSVGKPDTITDTKTEGKWMRLNHQNK